MMEKLMNFLKSLQQIPLGTVAPHPLILSLLTIVSQKYMVAPEEGNSRIIYAYNAKLQFPKR
jgi:hypothetical protein